MNPDARTLWSAPSWALSVLLACLGMLGPFSIDTYIPAFTGIAQAIGATPVQMQQTLSAYLFGFAVMNLFHGALSDSIGRRPIVLGGLVVFAIASVGCALSQSIGALVLFRGLQGMSAGAGIVVSRAVIRDMFPPGDAQRVMSQVTIYFGIAPAVAPMIGGFLFIHVGWHSIFWFLAAVGAVLFIANWKLLPETLHATHRQVFSVRNLLRGYWKLGSDPRFVTLALASGIPFNGMFLYVLSAPVFLGEHLQLGAGEFFWFFVLTIGGIMSGAFISGRMAGKVPAARQIRYGFSIMASVSVLNLLLNLAFVARPQWALLPIAVYAFGWAMMVPVVTLMVLDLVPERRGMASSLQAFVGSAANGIVAGVIAPLVMHSTTLLAATSVAMMSVGGLSWLWVRRRVATLPATPPSPA
ncbi:MAG: multidrug effflux MFS transporter [Pseudomonadota bacterium]|nr:multidrug effflux MFS transporter [Pseudomonadota bacterium]